MTIPFVFVSCENLNRSNIISDFEKAEEYRIWIIEKDINDEDSVYLEKKTFKSFDSNDRLINEGNFKFYYYKGNTGQIEKTKSVFTRDRNVNIYTEQYLYDQNGLLKCVLRIEDKTDTVKSFKYDKNKKLIESKTNYGKIVQEFENGLLKKKIEFEGADESRISEFKYDSLKRLIVENWIFSGNHRMKTRFEYNKRGKLQREIDSTYVQGDNPNQFIEFMTEYKYDSQDSITEIIELGRILSDTTFHVRGRKTFERKIEKKK